MNEKISVVEVCPHCGEENEFMWNYKEHGLTAFCPVCGNVMMLCDECMHRDDTNQNCAPVCEGHCCNFDPSAKHRGSDVPPENPSIFTIRLTTSQGDNGLSSHIVPIGDEHAIKIPEVAVDCSRLGFFDEAEQHCWELFREYCNLLGVELIPESGDETDVSFDIAKDIQEYVIGILQAAGVKTPDLIKKTSVVNDSVKSQCRYNKQLPDLIETLRGIDDSLKKIAEGQTNTDNRCNAGLTTSSLPSLYEKVPDSDLVAAMNNDELCILLAEVFEEEIQTDDETYRKKGYYLLKAILEKDLNGLLVAVCGWSIHSLLAKAKARAGVFSDVEEPEDVIYIRTVEDLLMCLETRSCDCRTYCQSVSFAVKAYNPQEECCLSDLLYPSTENVMRTVSEMIDYLEVLPKDMPINVNCNDCTVSLYPEKLNICF